MASEFSYRFTETAEKDLDGILGYISYTLCNPIASKNFYEELNQSLAAVTRFPDSGTPLNNPSVALDNIRKLYVKNYTVFYRADHESKMVIVLRIVYSHRNLDEIIRTIKL